MRADLEPSKVFGEDIRERLSRFGLIVENAHGNWDLSERDMAALRTANALLLEQRDLLSEFLGHAHLLELLPASIAERTRALFATTGVHP